jgi:Domain of unknown function (DUF3332)
MKKRIVRLATLLAATTFLMSATGCFGRFRAMSAVYDFNKSVSDSGVVRSLVTFALVVIPVYEVSFLVDWIVLNTLDFWNGDGKVAKTETLPDGTRVEMAKVDADTVRVRRVDPAGHVETFDVVRVGDHAGYVRAADGQITGGAERLPDGRIVRSAP